MEEAEQDWLAVQILATVNGDADREWDEKLAASLPQLDKLAAKALAEHRRGETRALEPDHL
jgi:hypothetical protein